MANDNGLLILAGLVGLGGAVYLYTRGKGNGGPPPVNATAPGAPGGVIASAGDGRATITWSPPASDGGSPVTGYVVTASPGGATNSPVPGSLSAGIGGLTNGTAYTFTVVAINAVGMGAPSAPSAAVTPTKYAPPQVQGPKVSNLRAITAASGTAVPPPPVIPNSPAVKNLRAWAAVSGTPVQPPPVIPDTPSVSNLRAWAIP